MRLNAQNIPQTNAGSDVTLVVFEYFRSFFVSLFFILVCFLLSSPLCSGQMDLIHCVSIVVSLSFVVSLISAYHLLLCYEMFPLEDCHFRGRAGKIYKRSTVPVLAEPVN